MRFGLIFRKIQSPTRDRVRPVLVGFRFATENLLKRTKGWIMACRFGTEKNESLDRLKACACKWVSECLHLWSQDEILSGPCPTFVQAVGMDSFMACPDDNSSFENRSLTVWHAVTGKSSLAIELADEVGCEITSSPSEGARGPSQFVYSP